MFESHFPQLLQAFELRSALVSYIYTEARKFYNTGIAPVHALYIDYPLNDESYLYKHQYKFGNSIITAPISTTTNSNNFSEKSVWLPNSGNAWFDWAGKNYYSGGTVVKQNYTTWEIPAFLEDTSIIPFKAGDARNVAPDITWTIWTSRDQQKGTVKASGSVYEDDGVSTAYQGSGSQAWTNCNCTISSSSVTCQISATVGTFPGQPATRQHSLQIRGFKGSMPTVTVNGVPATRISTCQTDTLVCPLGALVIDVGTFPIKSNVVIVVTY